MKTDRKILVVDDDKLTIDFLDLTLSKLGYQVYRASDGLEALEVVKKSNPDIILLDNMMPRMNGFEFTQILKKDKEFAEFSNTPIVMFSAKNDLEDKILGLEMGIDDYITKPFNFTEVLARIRNIIKHKELSNQIIKRERRLAILEAMNTNLIAFVRHVKKPMKDVKHDIDDIISGKSNNVQGFANKYKDFYNEVDAMVCSLEEEILDLESKRSSMKAEELSIDELEKKINKHIIQMKESYEK
ncbi:MAG: hypothetical protein A2015_11935 [Spirochaetes bacterium GWF1_31_7]|nr:MAG: hypothetical protein A2Y30_15140 [Spirochaetes bacterium GWE1_32_154]OHD49127.1 MAG: hypothetical protein A2015_11935 [Spirochaetes bacterium GWF1_31_7]OHD50287.1 MAG: hypothetical protein A2Y29_13190 [Spirochaetes bacterium GWE2_31_10]OHD82867.1 MAG: hypothetical protein A2355_08975 [Spirochaetes bacterium RIFOXYB1_FULL_32_8]HBD93927.1 response regulator [Spirochaetia bacterium]